MGDVTALLERAHGGDVQARNELFEHVYAELSRLARQKLARERTFTDLSAASLVHEAYLSLTRHEKLPGENRRMFFAYAAGVMRSVIIDYVRKRSAHKRGRLRWISVHAVYGNPRVLTETPQVKWVQTPGVWSP